MNQPLSRTLARRLLRTRRARRGDVTTVTVLDSRSMAPLIRGQCQAAVRWGVPEQGLPPGCLILAGWDDLLIVHRVVAKSTHGGQTVVLQMADNLDVANPFGATWLAEDDVLGVVHQVRDPQGAVRYAADWWLSRTVDRITAWQGQRLWSAIQRKQRLRAAVLRGARSAIFAAAALAVRSLAHLPVVGVPGRPIPPVAGRDGEPRTCRRVQGGPDERSALQPISRP